MDQQRKLQQEIAQLVTTYQRAPSSELALPLFQTLGWNGDGYRLELDRAETIGKSYRLVAAGETTAYLFVAPTDLHEPLLHMATNVAYNSGVNWAAITNFATTRLINARWSDDPTYLSLDARQYVPQIQQLALLSPEAIIDGRLAESAQATERQRKVLSPIDQNLMTRLEGWRRLLLTQSADVSDEQVHELIARLFFIRSCEDRDIIPRRSLMHLVEDRERGHSLGSRLNNLFEQLQADFDSELFVDRLGKLPLFDSGLLAQIIRELYSPYPGLPQYRYDFSYLNVDVLGKVYEQYVSTVLIRTQPSADSAQLRLFDAQEPQQEVVARSQRREHGVFFTPPYIVNYIVQHTVERLLQNAKTVDELPRVADISCGSGAFLTRTAERLAVRARELDPQAVEKNWGRRVIPRLAGVDIDQRAVTLARVNLWTLATLGEPPKPLPDLGSSIFAADALLAPEVDTWKEHFDVVVGNPPFRSAGEIDTASQDRLKRRYMVAQGRFDLAYVFMERALQLVKPGGYVGFVLPNRLYSNADARFLRDLIVQRGIIEQVVDFGHVPAFEEGLSYTTILIVQKRVLPAVELPSASDELPKARVHRVLKLSDYPGLQLRRADLREKTDWKDAYSHVFTSPQPRSGGPWIWWASDVDDRVRQKLAAGAVALSEIADLYQGIRTGADDIFILRRTREDVNAGRWILRNGRGDYAEIEPELLRPCARRGTISRYAIHPDPKGQEAEYLLYPYQRGQRLKEFELEVSFPATYTYLLKYKDQLRTRSTVERGGAWYDLSWPRSDAWLGKSKLLTAELVSQAAFAPDVLGEWVIVGGLAVLSRDPLRIPLYLLLGVLNSSLATWYLAHRAAYFQDGYLKVVKGQLAEFAFPWKLILAEPLLARRIANLAKEITRSVQFGLAMPDAVAEIDAILFNLLGLNPDEQRAVLDRVPGAQVRGRAGADQLIQPDQTVSRSNTFLALDRLFTRAEQANTQREQTTALLEARTAILSLFSENAVGQVRSVQALLTWALLGTEQLSRQQATRQQLQLLREIIAVSASGKVDTDVIVAFQRQLEAVGINVLPRIPGASAVMATASDDGFGEESERA